MRNTTITCDRCGRTREWEETADIKLRETTFQKVAWVKIYCRTGFKKKVDLCTDCLESLNNWFNYNFEGEEKENG